MYLKVPDVNYTELDVHCKNVWIKLTSTCFGYLSCIEQQNDDLQLRCPNWVKVTQSFLQCTIQQCVLNGRVCSK